jgi:nicotinate phosphoribosyltransferase
LDSGDLARLSKAAQRAFKQAGFEDPLIVASNELTEDLIADLKRQGAPINSWGVGTHLITSSEHPALGGVYKLVSVKTAEGPWEPRIKLSSNPAKMTDPGRKQVVRYTDEAGRFIADIVHLAGSMLDQPPPQDLLEGPILYADRLDVSYMHAVSGAVRCEHLLQTVMRDGVRTRPQPSLDEIRSRAKEQIASLPEETRRLRNPEIYTVGLSPDLVTEKFKLAAGAPGVVAVGPARSRRPAAGS